MEAFKKYIEQVLGITIQLDRIDVNTGLPFFITQGFQMFQGELFQKAFVLVMPKGKDHIEVERIVKVVSQITDGFGKPVMIVLDNTPAIPRKKLVSHGINFIVPFKQMFLPSFLTEFNEEMIRPVRRTEKLLPSAQAILIYHLLDKWRNVVDLPFKDLAERLGYSAMAITKAAANLQAFELCQIEGTKEKFIRFEKDGIEMWQQALEYLTSPVLRSVYVDEVPPSVFLLKSGESALPEYTAMNPSAQEYRAIEKNMFYALKKSDQLSNLNDWEGKYCLEIWKYNPTVLTVAASELEVVDPLSLYLSLRDTNDERIEMELEKLIEKYVW